MNVDNTVSVGAARFGRASLDLAAELDAEADRMPMPLDAKRVDVGAYVQAGAARGA